MFLISCYSYIEAQHTFFEFDTPQADQDRVFSYGRILYKYGRFQSVLSGAAIGTESYPTKIFFLSLMSGLCQ